MDSLFYVFFGVIGLGVGFVVWTYVDTRKKYYNEFMKRKSKREKFHIP